MDDREIIQWDKRLTDQARRGWDNYKHLHIDLSVARLDQSYLIAGEYLYVENSSSADAIAKIRLNRVNNDALDLEKGVKIETVFIEIFITNDALQDEWLDLVFGINFKYKKKIAEAGVGGGMTWVDRGDPAAPDWTELTLTLDGNWHDLDLSAIIDAGALLVIFRVFVIGGEGGPTDFMMRTNGNINEVNVDRVLPVVTFKTFFQSFIVTPDENGIVEYLGGAAIPDLDVTVAGWFI